jgi:hypothetical protein
MTDIQCIARPPSAAESSTASFRTREPTYGQHLIRAFGSILPNRDLAGGSTPVRHAWHLFGRVLLQRSTG